VNGIDVSAYWPPSPAAIFAMLASILSWWGNRKVSQIHIMVNSQREKMTEKLIGLEREVTELKSQIREGLGQDVNRLKNEIETLRNQGPK